MKQGRQSGVRLPEAPEVYSRTEEAQFRRDLAVALRDSMPNLRESVKTIRVPYTALQPVNNSTTFGYGTSYLHPNTIGATNEYHGTLILPQGVKVTQSQARLYRQTVSDIAEFSFVTVNESGGTTTVGTGAHSLTAAWQTLTVTPASDTVVESQIFLWTVRLNGAAVATDARVLWVDIQYMAPDYSTTY